ncbi:MAG TPA: undecaprenyl-diphosphate phosphatase [Candidatus Saccharibacteria bacterium]|nr:undecaprenyl-diphosphate phosphatase [Candidatus Saccharibacteria bacterium]
MTVLEAIVLGVVQGLTEFIPVSSSGHLVLAQWLFSGSADHLLIQALDFGTLAALLIYFWPKLVDLFRRVFYEKDYRLARNILITSIPAGLLGLLLADFIQSSTVLLTPLVVALMLASVGVLMVVVDKLPKKSAKETGTDLSPKRALIIGVAQAFALIPGVSRSGSTILASRIMGLAPKAAAEYSFMVSIPIMFGLIGKLLLKSSDRAYLAAHLDMVIIANIAAFISAILAIHVLLSYLSKHGLALFGWYRIALATVVIGVLLLQ